MNILKGWPVWVSFSACTAPALDIVYVMDGSGSIGTANFELAKEFVAITLDGFDIGEDKARVAVVQYSSSAQTEIRLGQFNNKTQLMAAVRAIGYVTY